MSDATTRFRPIARIGLGSGSLLAPQIVADAADEDLDSVIVRARSDVLEPY